MNNFQTINRSLGWAFFSVAATVYALTVAPSTSFWDCGEYIAAAYKLQIPHPPGAPLFLLIGRLFALLAGSNVTRVAYWINMSSALASAGSVMVVFWIISLLSRKVMGKKASELSLPEAGMIWTAGGVGALALTFCDTFWTNATEAETYALSTLVLVLCVWAMLQWDLATDRAQANRWLILTAYLMGLSTGLRIFSLLTLPALCLIFYFKQRSYATILGTIQALLIGTGLIGVIYLGIIPGLPKLAFWCDWLLVNQLGLPFGSGIATLLALVVVALVCGLIYTASRQYEILNVGLLCLTFLLIGYASHTLELVRAQAGPPINENDPSNVVNFISYLQRDQYGRKPLLYGPNFTATILDQKKGTPVYRKGAHRYEIVGHRLKNVFDPQTCTLLPRMGDRSTAQAKAYRTLLGLKPDQQPTFWDNCWFFLKYQLWRGYGRYFLWNFAGRASDAQDAVWLSPLDAYRKVPQAIAQNKGRCNYFLLPLLLGLLGAVLQCSRTPKSFLALLVLFLMLGVAFLFFWNPPPVEPRARDYFYANSFLIFTLWIGLGALAVMRYFHSKGKLPIATTLGAICCLAVPLYMGAQGWQYHDRSQRYLCVDSAKNLLNACAPHAILFTGGDNDTFPLWYVQEVEGFRTDVRVVVLTYANTDWYIQQLRRPAYQAAALPFTLPQAQYRQYGLNDFLPYIPRLGVQGALDVENYLRLIQSADPVLQVRTATGECNNSLPTREMALHIDKKAVLRQGIVPQQFQHWLADTVTWHLKGRGLEKKELLLLDLLVHNRWERPIYFNPTSLHNLSIELRHCTVHEGPVLRLLPIQNPTNTVLVNTAAMYNQLIHQCQWRGLNSPQVHYDENQRGFVVNYRLLFNTLAKALLREGNKEQARKVLLRCLAVMPDCTIPYDAANACMIAPLLTVGEQEVALTMAHTLCKRAEDLLAYQAALGLRNTPSTQQQLATLSEAARALYQAGYEDLAQAYYAVFQEYHQER
ncbi:MAG: DUF2723 domain-containing protein [Bacteroidota bacterium]